MPSKSKKQHNFMAAVANNPAFAKKVGIKPSVGKEFIKADKGRKFREGGSLKEVDSESNPGLAKLPTEVRNKMGYMKKGGEVKHSDVKMDKKVVKKAVGMHEKQLHGGKKSDLTKLRSGGACGPKKMASGGLSAGHKAADGIAKKGKTKGMEVKMAKGGYAKGGMAKKKYC